MKNQFKVNECVELKSGGPRMKIRKIYKNGFLKCYWIKRPNAVFFRFSSGIFNPLIVRYI